MQNYMIGILILTICMGGCARTLPPREELTQAVTKSFAASGFNYTSKSRITDLNVPRKDLPKMPGKKTNLALDKGLEVLDSLSVTLDGAVDTTAKRSQVLYALRYERDNLEISVKLPILMDYGTQTVYLGTSIYTTVLESLYPQAPPTRGKLIRIDLNKLLQEGTAKKPELAKVVGSNLLNGKNIDLINNAIKAAVLKELPKLKEDCFRDQPLSDQDRQAGVIRRIRVDLGRSESVSLALGAMESVVEALYQQQIIPEQVYTVLLTLTDPKFAEEAMEKLSINATFHVGIAPSGQVAYVEGQYDMADRQEQFRVGVETVSTFSNYGAPRFTLLPEQSGVVDFTELLKVIAVSAQEKKADVDASNAEEIDETSKDGALDTKGDVWLQGADVAL